jgi:hypothetical protein
MWCGQFERPSHISLRRRSMLSRRAPTTGLCASNLRRTWQGKSGRSPAVGAIALWRKLWNLPPSGHCLGSGRLWRLNVLKSQELVRNQ